MNKETGGTAFPVSINTGNGVHWSKGMTLRDYFAAKAMQAAMSKNELDHHSMKDIAEGSYKFADAMLKAREQ